jgi:hypothetical protein
MNATAFLQAGRMRPPDFRDFGWPKAMVNVTRRRSAHFAGNSSAPLLNMSLGEIAPGKLLIASA